MSTTDSNVLSFSIPTSLSGGGNFGLNFDFGANAPAIAQGAYDFLNSTQAANTAFVGGAISGSQSFLSSFISPIVNASAAQLNQNATQIPDLYKSLFSANQMANQDIVGITNTAAAAQQSIAQASIAESKSAASQGDVGLCFITTAVCENSGLPDDCEILQTLRKFRDDYMRSDEEKSAMVEEYYRIAPEIVRGVKEKSNAKLAFDYMLHAFIRPACYAIQQGNMERAFTLYCELVDFAREVAHG